jgi:hypothetical protein
MNLIIKHVDIYDIGHDDSINEYIVYVSTTDNVLIKAYDKIYGEQALGESVYLLKNQYQIDTVIQVDYDKTIEDALS